MAYKLWQSLLGHHLPRIMESAAFTHAVTSIPGIGPVYGAGIVAEIGPIQRFASDDALAKYAGLTWRTHQSGQFDAEARPLTRSGNVYWRDDLIEAADKVRVQGPQCASLLRAEVS